MVKLELEVCGAIQMLKNSNTKILYVDDGPYNDMSVFPEIDPNLKLKPRKVRIEAIPEALTHSNIQKMEYDELIALGYMIVARIPEIKTYRGQKLEYAIVKYDDEIIDYGRVPPDHWIEYDISKRALRLIGRTLGIGAISNWIPIDQKIEVHESVSEFDRMIHQAQQIKQTESPMTIDIYDPELLDVPELPVGMTDTGDLICIGDSADAPPIGIFGGRGSGKSTIMNAICSRAYWEWNKRCIVLNDKLKECWAWALPWNPSLENKDFLDLLNYCNEKTLGLPAAHLHPICAKDDFDAKMTYQGLTGVKISLPFKKVILDYENVLKGYPRWQFKNSGTWFRNLLFDPITNKQIPDLLECKTPQQFNQILDERFDKSSRNVKEKISTVLSDIYNQKFLDISTGIPSSWKVINEKEERIYSPWMACLYANIVPIIESFTILEPPKPYFPQYLKFIIEDLMAVQGTDPYFKNNEISVWCFIDELTGIASKKNLTVASEALQTLVTEGRPLRIATVYATQNYSTVFTRIASNTDYAFVFRQAGADLKALQKDWPKIDGRGWKNQIMNLKQWECIALTKKHFVVYNISGTRKLVDVPIKMRVLPPLNQHAKPMKGP